LESYGIEFKKLKETNRQTYLVTFQQCDPNADLVKSICDWFDCYEQQRNVNLGEVDIRISIEVSSAIYNYGHGYSNTTYLIYNSLLSDKPKRQIEKSEPIQLEPIHIKIKDKKVRFLIGAKVETNKSTNKKDYYPFIFPSRPNKYLRLGQQLSDKSHSTREEAVSQAKILAEQFIQHQVEFRKKYMGQSKFWEVFYDDKNKLMEIIGASSDDTLLTNNVYEMQQAGLSARCQTVDISIPKEEIKLSGYKIETDVYSRLINEYELLTRKQLKRW
jgi:hypothetical protein